MSNYTNQFDTDTVPTPRRQHQLSANGHWIFGSIYAVLTLVGFGFGVWAGAAKPKPLEVAEKQKDADKDKNAARPPTTTPPTTTPAPTPAEPKKEPEPKPKEPEPKPKEPEPKPKPVEPEPKPKPKEPEPKPPARDVSFKEIEPILRRSCNECHGLSAGKPKGGLDLRTIAAIKKGGNNGEVLVVGDPLKSTLYTSLTPKAREPMPPDGAKQPRPTDKEIDLIRDWIASGAKPRRTVRPRRGVTRAPGASWN